MRKALIPVFLLLLGAAVIGATAFREQVAGTTPFQEVIVQNPSTNPVQVKQLGTSTVSGTLGIDPNQNTVNLGSTDSGHLANIESDLSKLKFDSNGNLIVVVQAPGPVTQQCLNGQNAPPNGIWFLKADNNVIYTLCSGQNFYLTSLTAGGMDDNLFIQFDDGNNHVLDLEGTGFSGSASYQMDLTHPIHVTDVKAKCVNASDACSFTLHLLGNSTGT